MQRAYVKAQRTLKFYSSDFWTDFDVQVTVQRDNFL